MKRMMYLLVAVILVIGLVGCSGSGQPGDPDNGQNVNQGETGNDNKEPNGDVTIIPRDKDQEIEVVGIDELHRGRAWDITPDGKTLLFSWDEDAVEKDSGGEVRPPAFLYAMNLVDQTIEKLSTGAMNQGFASYSPDGKLIAFMENEGEVFFSFVMENRANADKVALKGGKGDNILLTAPPLNWSPDGELIAVSEFYMNNGQIKFFNTKGSEKKVITGNKMTIPWFLDRETLLFIEDRAIVALDITAADAVPKQITAGIDYVVSPNKQRLAYIPEAGDELKIKVAALDGNIELGSVLAEVNVGWGYQFTWSPDSQYLLYTDGGSVWLLNPETNVKKELASGMNFILNLHWSTNNEIIFSAMPADTGDDIVRTYRIELK